MDFEQVWLLIQVALRSGDVIPVWSVAGQTRSAPFTIRLVEPTYLEVDPPAAQRSQRIEKAEFQKVYRVWPDYCNRSVPRHELRDLTQYSTYIISILHWLEGKTGPLSRRMA